MSERMNGHAQMDANAAATIAANEAEMHEEGLAMDAQSELDAARDITDAYVLNRQIDQGAVMADKIDSIEARRTSPEVRAMNEAADMEIFGTRGRTQGYVDAEGKPLTEPIPGIVDQIRGTPQAAEAAKRAAEEVAEMRGNPRYGTKESDRHAAADRRETQFKAEMAQFKASQGERDERADGYVESIEELQELKAGGYELSQAQLIQELASEIGASQHALMDKIVAQAAGGRTLSAEEDQKIRSEAVGRVVDQTVRQGNDVRMLMRVIKQEGLFNRDEYEKFRYKRGNEKNGERKEFTFYREQSIANYKDNNDVMDRNKLVNDLNAKELDRDNKAEMKADAEADAAKRREDEANTAKIPVIDPTPKGLRARARHIMAGAAVAVQMKLAQAAEYFTDDEKGKKRRRVAAGVAGAVVLAGVSYFELKGMGSGGSHGSEGIVPPLKPHHHEAVQHAQEHARQVTESTPVHKSVNSGTTVPGVHEAGQHKDALSLSHEGDTIEGQVAGYLHTDLKDPAVTKVTEVVLHNQGISWNDARHLPVGYSFNMPSQHVIEDLLKTANS